MDYHCSTSSSRRSNMASSQKLFDLKEMSEFWAKSILCNGLPLRPKSWCRIKQVPYQLHELEVRYSWKKLRFYTDDPTVVSFSNGHGPACVKLAQARFVNNTDTEQTYSFSVDKTTRCQAVVQMQQGVSIGEETNVHFPVPDEIRNEINEFGDILRVTNIHGYKLETPMQWSGKHPVCLQAGSSATAEVQVLERYVNVQFTGKSVVRGKVGVHVVDPNHNDKLVTELETDIAYIVKFYFENAQRSEQWCPQDCLWEIHHESVTFPVKGNCFFQYGYENCVKINTDW